MPNWCNNQLTLRGSNQQEILRLAEAFKNQSFCAAVIPIPEELNDPETGSYGGDNAEDRDRLRESLTEKYGYSGWYDFCVDRWGTKWDVGDETSLDLHEDGLGFDASFDSAWSPPLGVYEELQNQGFEVQAMYYEPGMGFAGVWDCGGDDYYELGNMTADQVEQDLPSDLDECFAISENMREWAEENQEDEELTEWIRDGVEKIESGKDS